jgi:hypothetical protein
MTLPAPEPLPQSTRDDMSRGPRPAIVTTAVWLQLVAVVTALAAIAVTWLGYVAYDSLISRAAQIVPGAEPGIVAGERGGNLFGAIVGTVLFGAVALGFGLTARPMWKGSNIARLLNLIGSGLLAGGALLFCVCGGIGGVMMIPLLGAGISTSDPYLPPDEAFPADPWTPEPFYNALWDLEADSMMWHSIAVGLSVPLLLLIAMAAFVLLIVPPSARWFSPASASASAVKVQHVYVPVYYPYPYPYPYPPAPYPPAPAAPATPPAGQAPETPQTPPSDDGQPQN